MVERHLPIVCSHWLMGNRINGLLLKLPWEIVLFITDGWLLHFPKVMLFPFLLRKLFMFHTESMFASGDKLPIKGVQEKYLVIPEILKKAGGQASGGIHKF